MIVIQIMTNLYQTKIVPIIFEIPKIYISTYVYVYVTYRLFVSFLHINLHGEKSFLKSRKYIHSYTK